MKITRQDPFTGKENTLEIPVTEAQLNRWRGGQLIQNAMRNLTVDEREFIITGLTPDSWNEIFRDSETDKGTEDEIAEGIVIHTNDGKEPAF